MRFNISSPPEFDGEGGDYTARLVSWLTVLAEELNVTLGNLTAENFSAGTRKIFDLMSERTNDVDLHDQER